MSLGQGSCRQTPWWVWAVMMLSAIVFLPGASRVTAQDNESPTQQPRLPRPIMASPSGPPPLPRAHPVHQTDWSVDRIEVREVLEPLMKSGLTEKAAAQQLIQSLPTAPAETLNRNAQLATEDGVVHLGGEHPYRQIVRETLYVFGSREYRQAIADQVAHFRQYGFESALISATIIQVPAEQWEELGISWHATNEAASENLSRESFGFDADVTGTVVARATEFSDSISSSPRPKSLVQQTNATSSMPKQAQLSIATLDPDSVDGLVRSIEGAKVLSRPQMVTHNGRQASVEIGQIKSLTTGFQAIRNEAGKRAYTPVTSDVHSGLRMTLRPEFVGADQLRMEFNLSISKVVSIESVSLQIPHSDKPMQIQIPEMSERNCAWNGQFSLGKTLAIGGEPIHEGDQSFRTLCLIVCQKVARTKLNSNPSAENDPSQATPTGRRFKIRRLAK